MDNCFELRNVIIKALNKSGGKGFSYYSEFDKPSEMLKAVRKEISGFSENIWDNFFQNMSKAFNETLEKLKGEKLKITYDGGEDAKIIDLHELIHNEAGYTVGSAHLNDGYYISRGREGIPDNEYHIEIKGENISRIHGVIFFDESMDSLIYRRTTFHKKEETAFEKTIKTDDFEIFDGALIYIGDTLVKFEYIQ